MINNNLSSGGKTMTKLSKAQEKMLNEIQSAEITTPDKSYGGWMTVSEDWTSNETDFIWKAGKIYARYKNSATLKALEKKGLIKIHQLGGSHCGTDIVSILK